MFQLFSHNEMIAHLLKKSTPINKINNFEICRISRINIQYKYNSD